MNFTPFWGKKSVTDKKSVLPILLAALLFFKYFPYEGSAVFSQFSQEVENERTLTQFLIVF